MTKYYILILQIVVINVSGQIRNSDNRYGQSGKSPVKQVYISKVPRPTAPALLEVSSIKVEDEAGNLNKILDANETINVEFLVTNIGKGDAYAVELKISLRSAVVNGFDYPQKKIIGNIKSGEKLKVNIPISGSMKLTSGKVELLFELVEGNGFNAEPFLVSFNTQEFINPELRIVDYKFTNEKGGKIQLGEINTLSFIVQNRGQGEATSIKIKISIPDNVYPANDSEYYISELEPNESRQINYDFFTNRKYIGEDIPINIKITESYLKYGEIKILHVGLDETIGETHLTNVAGIYKQNIEINNPSLYSDVDKDIPITRNLDDNKFALIIGNEDYTEHQKGISSEMNVPFAKNDALIFKEYCVKTLGVPSENITLILDATAGKMWQAISKIKNLIKVTNGEANVYVYYAGHGFPDEESKIPYLIPVDVSGSNLTSSIPLSKLYESLSEYPSKKVTLFIDACFSGGARNVGLLSSRGVSIKPKDVSLKGNLVVFTASSGNESSLAWNSKQHGMFTYFLLKKIKDSKGDITYEELDSYLKEKVGLESIRVNNKIQTPQVLISSEMKDKWQSINLN